MAKTKSKKYPYKWADGSYHSIPASTHAQNVKAKQYGINLDDPVPTPLTNRGAFGMAEAGADREYGPQISAAQGIQTALPSWFQNYTNTVGTAQAAAQQYAQPLLAGAQTAVTNAGQTAPGLDPSSPQYAKEQQAAAGRQAITQSSANTLGAVALANDQYFGGLKTIAARELPQAQAYYGTEVGRLKGLRGAGVVDRYGQIRTGEQNADIGYKTLNLNTAKAADINPVTGKKNPKPAEKPYSSGVFAGMTPSEVRALPDDVKATMRTESKDPEKPYSSGPFAGSTPSEVLRHSKTWVNRKVKAYKGTGGGAAADKKKGAIEKATGKGRIEISNIAEAWHGYVGKTVEDRDKAPDPVTGQYPRRAITPSDIKRILGKKYDSGAIHVALLVDGGKPLDQAAIAYLHSRDPNFRIPREWLRGKKTKSSGKSDPKPTSGQQGGLGGK